FFVIYLKSNPSYMHPYLKYTSQNNSISLQSFYTSFNHTMVDFWPCLMPLCPLKTLLLIIFKAYKPFFNKLALLLHISKFEKSNKPPSLSLRITPAPLCLQLSCPRGYPKRGSPSHIILKLKNDFPSHAKASTPYVRRTAHPRISDGLFH